MSLIKFKSITQHSLDFLFSANRYAAKSTNPGLSFKYEGGEEAHEKPQGF